MNNLSTTAKKLDRVFEIFGIVLFAVSIACVVLAVGIGLVYLLKLDPQIIGTAHEKLEVGFLELTVAQQYAPNKWLVLLQSAITLLAAFRLCWDGRRGTGYIRQILKPMMDGKPFDRIVSVNLKKLARLSINLGILANIIILSEQMIAVFVYDLPTLLISEKITHVGGMFQVNLSFLIYWAIFMLLSYVFSYGEQLQQLDDETL